MKLFRYTAILVFELLALNACTQKQAPKEVLKKVFLEGNIQGSTYHITYMHPKGTNFHPEIKKALADFDKTFSVFDSLSLISRINRNEPNITLNPLFIDVFTKAQEVSAKTNGAFDMTVGPLVHLWGFNNGAKITVTQHMVDSLKPFIGYKKVHLMGNKLVKDSAQIWLDANAIAQGYSCDIIAKLLESKGVKNYMVEIGGEIMTKGTSPRGDAWKIGINKPIDDSTSTVNQIQDVIKLENIGLATSGNYRKFYMHNGQKYGHEIDPETGYPVTHNLLSVTVIAPNCITADAYATAFMVLGVVKSVHLLQKLPGIEAYFIYRDTNGKNKVIYTRGFEKFLKK